MHIRPNIKEKSGVVIVMTLVEIKEQVIGGVRLTRLTFVPEPEDAVRNRMVFHLTQEQVIELHANLHCTLQAGEKYRMDLY
jgi:hypothetical protein